MAVWRSDSNGGYPSDAVSDGCYDINNETIYVGRARESGDLIPGKVVPSHKMLYVAYDGKEKKHKQYECLVRPIYGKYGWSSAHNGAVPSGAIEAGRTASGEALYIGRAYHSGSVVIGKVHPSHRFMYIPFDGKEFKYSNYEVLVIMYPDGPPLPPKV